MSVYGDVILVVSMQEYLILILSLSFVVSSEGLSLAIANTFSVYYHYK